MDFVIGEKYQLKKKHPCGADVFLLVQIGLDARLVCTGCGRKLSLKRRDFEKSAAPLTDSGRA